MPTNREDIQALFSIGDIFPRISRDEHKLRVTAILEDRIQLQPVMAGGSEISLEYDAVSRMLQAGSSDSDGPTPMRFFATEYLRRAQIRRDEEVDALWDSAGELFLGPVCAPGLPCQEPLPGDFAAPLTSGRQP